MNEASDLLWDLRGVVYIVRHSKNKLQREILIIMSDNISFFVSSQTIPRSPCTSETTKVGSHLPVPWSPMLPFGVLLNCAFNCCCFPASCFVFTAEVPDCFLIILADVRFDQLINFILQQTVMLYGPLWAAAVNYNVCSDVRG